MGHVFPKRATSSSKFLLFIFYYFRIDDAELSRTIGITSPPNAEIFRPYSVITVPRRIQRSPATVRIFFDRIRDRIHLERFRSIRI